MRARIVLSSLLVLALAACERAPDRNLNELETEAAAFAAKMGADRVRGVACVDRDSDRDGYVSCTVFRDEAQPLNLECLLSKEFNGCKVKVLEVNITNVTK